MRPTILIVLFLGIGTFVRAESGTPEAGEAVFNSNCASCHGLGGTGGRGPDLRGQLRNGDQDGDLAKVVQNGISGTGMPAFHMDKVDLEGLVKYIQKLRHGTPPSPPPVGDLAAGKRIYQTHGCAGCHEIGGEGSSFGPSLTRVGAGRSYEYLKASVLNPSADVPDKFQGVTVIDRNGKRYHGIRINEDTFTIQMRLPNQEFISFDKGSLRSLIHEKKSLMPAYALAGNDLKDLLFYLSSLTGPSAASGTQQKERPR